MEEPKTTNKWENPIFETNHGDPLDFELLLSTLWDTSKSMKANPTTGQKIKMNSKMIQEIE